MVLFILTRKKLLKTLFQVLDTETALSNCTFARAYPFPAKWPLGAFNEGILFSISDSVPRWFCTGK
jgi:hypothetical protein